MIKDGKTISTKEIAEITCENNEDVMAGAKIMLLGLHGDMNINRFEWADPDYFVLSYKHALVLSGHYPHYLAAKIIDALED